MSWKKYKYIYLVLLLVFFLSSGLSYYWVSQSRPQKKPKIPISEPSITEVFMVSDETRVILKEKYIICEKYFLQCPFVELEMTDQERDEINGLTLEELENKLYSENKTIEENNNVISIISWKDGLCSEHKKIWHLGANSTNEYVTVYYGPGKVQNEGGIYKVTEISIKQLPVEYQGKINNYTMEFTEEEDLIATLDSFSE